MKSVLSFLMCVILVNAVTPCAYGKRGGPDASNQSSNFFNVIGTYSGVLVPVSERGTNTGQTSQDFNSLGIFSMVAPTAGASTGTFTFFANGEVFAGTITGIIDPNGRSLNGVLDASSTLDTGFGDDFEGEALGVISAVILKSPFTSLINRGSSARLTGFAHMDLFFGSGASSGSFDFIVDGFKQSDTVSTVTLPTGNATNGTVNGGTGTTGTGTTGTGTGITGGGVP